ncbi:MAG: EamA family transporter [Phaeodactylibacter sp.]|nr:EamA family transporter [Phaeodactylibacter sp.]MCB9047901.1 EamA family transporter [Lewinellaceae bacterium]
MNATTTKAKAGEPVVVPDWKSWAVLLALSLIWGSSYILIKKGLEVFSSNQVATLRLSISALAFIPVLIYRFRRVDWSRWKPLLVVGLTGTAIPAFMFSIAQVHISSSVAGVLNSLTPLFTLLLGVLLFGSSAHWAKVSGVLVGLLGAAMLILFGKEAGAQGNPWFGLLVVVGTICYATSSNVVGAYLRDMSAVTISAAAFVMVGLPALGFLFSTDFTEVLGHREGAWLALGYIAILSLVGTVLASIIFFKLVQWTTPVFASMISYLVPIVALSWGAIDGEPITMIHLLGMGLILSGVYLVKK